MEQTCVPAAWLVWNGCATPSRPHGWCWINLRMFILWSAYKRAEQFAAQHGMRLVDNSELIVPRERERLMAFQQHVAEGGRDTTFSGADVVPPYSSGSITPSDKERPLGTPIVPDEWATPQMELEREVERALPEELQVEDPTLHSHDTVGAVALDSFGNLAAATSTGGTLSKAPGRVGDSSLIGCGCYADNQSAAVSLTGWGEPIMKLVLGKWAVDRVAAGASPEQAASDAIAYLFSRLGGHGGIILLGPDGRWGIAHNTPRIAWGIAEESGTQVGIARQWADSRAVKSSTAASRSGEERSSR